MAAWQNSVLVVHTHTPNSLLQGISFFIKQKFPYLQLITRFSSLVFYKWNPNFNVHMLSAKLYLCRYVDKRHRVNARIIKVFKPFTLSCAMVVQLDCPPFKGQFVLKLYDRRFSTQLRRDEKASPWNSEIESRRVWVCDGG